MNIFGNQQNNKNWGFSENEIDLFNSLLDSRNALTTIKNSFDNGSSTIFPLSKNMVNRFHDYCILNKIPIQRVFLCSTNGKPIQAKWDEISEKHSKSAIIVGPIILHEYNGPPLDKTNKDLAGFYELNTAYEIGVFNAGAYGSWYNLSPHLSKTSTGGLNLSRLKAVVKTRTKPKKKKSVTKSLPPKSVTKSLPPKSENHNTENRRTVIFDLPNGTKMTVPLSKKEIAEIIH